MAALRPYHTGGGSSASAVPAPLALRTRWMHAALLAVLSHTHTIRKKNTKLPALWSATVAPPSRQPLALFYAVYILLHLPPGLTATSWTLSGPFVPPREPRRGGLRRCRGRGHAADPAMRAGGRF
ncbi:hypothetical protein DFH09DRAFT_1318191 [Mycena vulgaris]|nr:hypothetical protein DFH09DRAFT_1318191 [Mycena vulgaris]